MNMLRITGAAAAAVLMSLSLVSSPARAAATGVIEGGITDQAGQPADATVTLRSTDDNVVRTVYTWDFPDGRYRFEGLEPGRYQIELYDNYYGRQWIPGKESRGYSKVFVVTEGATVTADDQWLPFGTIRVRVTDAETGKAVPRPCVYVDTVPQDRQGCGTKGVVELTDVPPGDWEITVTGYPSHFPEEPKYVSVERSETTRVKSSLVPGAALTTRIVDAETGDPVSSVCVHTVDPVWSGQSARMGQDCTGDDGVLELGPFAEATTFNLYAYQPRSPWTTPDKFYGAQWVGTSGGTGDQREALKVRLTEKRLRTIPDIRMDAPGTITGTITDAATEQPVAGVCAYPFAFHPGQGHLFGKQCSNVQGTYVIENLGPYEWPVEFTPTLNTGYAWQWSGNAPNRFAATYTQVTAGAGATVDGNLVRAGAFAGKVTHDGQPVRSAYVTAYNRATRDPAGPSWDYSDDAGAYHLSGYRDQQLWVYYYADGVEC